MSEKNKNIYLLSSFTIDPLKDNIEKIGNAENRSVQVTVGPYNQIVASCINEQSELYKNHVDVLVVWFRLEDLLGRTDFYHDEVIKTAQNDIKMFFNAVYHAKEKLQCELIFVLPGRIESNPLGIGDMQLNRGITKVSLDFRKYFLERCINQAQVSVIDAEDILRVVGTMNAYNMAMYAYAKIPFTAIVYQKMAQMIYRTLFAIKEPKVFVIDADVLFCEPKNKNVLNEIEEERLVLDDSGLMVQEYVKELILWGHSFLLCTSSDEDALGHLLERRDVVLSKEDFSYRLCACHSYEEVMQKVQGLNGIDTNQLVLLDTKEVESLDCKCLVLPDDNVLWKECIEQSGVLDYLPREEQYYHSGLGVEKSEITFNILDFYQNNDLSVELIKCCKENVERVEHVFESVKDFNFTGTYYDKESLIKMTEEENKLLFGISVEDRFGNYGIAGALLGDIVGDTLEMDNVLLNCRVLGKKVEYHVLQQLAEMLIELKVTHVAIHYATNGRNKIVADFIKEMSKEPLEKNLEVNVIRLEVQRLLAFAKENLDAKKKKLSHDNKMNFNPFKMFHEFFKNKTEEKERIIKTIETKAEVVTIIEEMRKVSMRTRDDGMVDYVEPRTNTETKVAILWKEILNLDRVGIYDNFFQIGGNSLMAAQLIIKFQMEFGMTLPVRIFFDNSSVEQMAAYIDAVLQNNDKASLNANAVSDFRYKTREFLKNEVWLADDITAQKKFQNTVEKVENVLLTGATGFLGAFLLHDLIEKTKYTIYTLVKAEDEECGMQRIIKNLEKYSLWDDSFKSRIRIVIGDLSKAQMGMSEEVFCVLAEKIHEIYHAAANTNFLQPYHMLKEVNVYGTQEIIRFATTYQLKRVHYISTHYVFSNLSHENGYIAYEDTFPTEQEVLVLGYQQSKWVGENIMQIAKSRGVPVSVYRVGRISGSSVNGACQTKDIMWMMIKCCVEAGVLFEENVKIEFIPVDYVSQSIVALSLCKDSCNKNYHLCANELNDLKQIYEWMKQYGFKVETLPYAEWKKELVKRVSESEKMFTAKAMLPFIPEDMSEWDVEIVYDNRNVKNGLRGKNIPVPIVTKEVFRKYLDYFVETKFFEI